jgi:primosomal protein N' (replication factor Y)
VLVQTDLPEHEVIRAAVRVDPGPVAEAELRRRELLELPPVGSVAAVGGEAAPELVASLGDAVGLDVRGPRDGWWLVRAAGADELSTALGAVERPPGRLRLRIDPARLP